MTVYNVKPLFSDCTCDSLLLISKRSTISIVATEVKKPIYFPGLISMLG